MTMTVDDVMMLLEDERAMELASAQRTMDLIKKTRNPFRRIAMKQHYRTLMDHSIGVKLAILRINRIKREMEP